MKTYKKITKTQNEAQRLETGETWVGESIEDKCRRVTESDAPIEAISPMLYQERKAGVDPACNIRTDKWDIALNAMETIAKGTRQKREERMNAKTDTATATNSEVNVQN